MRDTRPRLRRHVFRPVGPLTAQAALLYDKWERKLFQVCTDELEYVVQVSVLAGALDHLLDGAASKMDGMITRKLADHVRMMHMGLPAGARLGLMLALHAAVPPAYKNRQGVLYGILLWERRLFDMATSSSEYEAIAAERMPRLLASLRGLCSPEQSVSIAHRKRPLETEGGSRDGPRPRVVAVPRPA
ncbi:hypothetical protein AB1Y20_004989 [Prymnesium parvum]|uniref:Uncharacterized protein n=1 Tax=Prymnesium parvum TaxID=97485 RepID=A0AB34J4X5_PRYPA